MRTALVMGLSFLALTGGCKKRTAAVAESKPAYKSQPVAPHPQRPTNVPLDAWDWGTTEFVSDPPGTHLWINGTYLGRMPMQISGWTTGPGVAAFRAIAKQ